MRSKSFDNKNCYTKNLKDLDIRNVCNGRLFFGENAPNLDFYDCSFENVSARIHQGVVTFGVFEHVCLSRFFVIDVTRPVP